MHSESCVEWRVNLEERKMFMEMTLEELELALKIVQCDPKCDGCDRIKERIQKYIEELSQKQQGKIEV